MNEIFFGDIDIKLPLRPYLFIGDEMPHNPRARLFDPTKHSFNPLTNIDYKTAREQSVVLYSLYPEGENTLTIRNGKRALFQLLRQKPTRLDRIYADIKDASPGTIEAIHLIKDILASPLLKHVFCGRKPFSFAENSIILARVNRAEIGDYDALVIVSMLMSIYKGPIVLEDGNFYLRDIHIGSVLRQNRLTTRISTLSTLSTPLRTAILSAYKKQPTKEDYVRGCLYDDAATLAHYAGRERGTIAFSDFVHHAMQT